MRPLSEHRAAAGLSAAELAQRAKVPEHVIAAIEAGALAVSYTTQIVIAGVLGLTPADIAEFRRPPGWAAN